MGIHSILKTFSVTVTLFLAHNASLVCATKPLTYGIVLVRAFDTLDVYAPIEILQLVSSMHKIQISLIAETPEVTTEPMSAMMNPFNSTVWPRVPTTHTFATAPRDFDVLIIPGGPGVRSPYINSTLEWIREVTPRVGTVITICTGSGLAARAGIMNGRKATTNKTSWPGIIPFGPNTTWIPHARWVVDDTGTPPIWSSSGVTAGMDLMFSFVETNYGKDNATFIAKLMEYERHTDPSWDPWARNETVVI